MSGFLCLKWNNHCAAFINKINNIQCKGKYCDATIICQGKFFAVHKIILSTCSNYFEELFDRMESQYPYIVFKDIEAREMELLLNYMYQGEVNVLQDSLPSLIKAAETLKIKGLAVSDDIISNKEVHKKKEAKSCQGSAVQPNNQVKEKKRQITSETEINDHGIVNNSNKISDYSNHNSYVEVQVKEEPVDTSNYENSSSEINDGKMSIDLPKYSYNNEGMFTDNDANTDIKKEVCTSLPINYEAQNFQRADEDVANLQKRAKTVTKPSGKDRRVVHQCSFCSYRSYNLTSVKTHTRFKHTKERPFHCSFCSLRFTTKLILDRHVRVHTGDKPFKCDICGKTFIQKISLIKHLPKHNLNFGL